MENENLLHISFSPHIRGTQTITKIMLDVIIALIPALIASVLIFGLRALLMTLAAVAAAVTTEHIISVFLLKKKTTVGDLSAVVTGMLLAFNLPVAINPAMTILGAVFAIAIVKCAFGGLGFNFMNPALAGRAFLLASYPMAMTGSIFARSGYLGKLPENLSGINIDAISGASAIDGISTATPLVAIKIIQAVKTIELTDLQDSFYSLFIGNIGGTIGETSVLALLLGGIYLIYRGIINPVVPALYIGGVFLLYLIFGQTDVSFFSGTAFTVAMFQILSGGLFLGAFFMATDMTTTPITAKGQAIFAAGCAIITFIIREFGGYPEGCSYSILLMNLFTPLIDKCVKPRVYGTGRKR
ncbi:MAG: RnfABCDGE type electron transport complex subunit D [Chitinispirillales bacterium]|jgi:electron transport complex protein RnfD|nr:RnfABCDGE type electron transport complex subunit D [Chitinispirillales bacterium]